ANITTEAEKTKILKDGLKELLKDSIAENASLGDKIGNLDEASTVNIFIHFYNKGLQPNLPAPEPAPEPALASNNTEVAKKAAITGAAVVSAGTGLYNAASLGKFAWNMMPSFSSLPSMQNISCWIGGGFKNACNRFIPTMV
ncbi:MAG: hypothetical protein ACJARD_000926, partial [Alphaproteobacteria bacterium]